jgi:hypothetical protein
VRNRPVFFISISAVWTGIVLDEQLAVSYTGGKLPRWCSSWRWSPGA